MQGSGQEEMEKRRRKKNVYEKYDYESTYEQDIDILAEHQMLELLKSGKRQVYATKEIRAGEQLEVEIYPEFTKGQRQLIPDEARRKKQRQAQRNLNEKNSWKQCVRVINENFTDRDIWATFTYTDEQMPETMEQAQQNMQRYIKRLNYHRKKRELPNARYVYTTECSKRGRWHHHIVLDGDMEMDIVESLWTAGRRNEVRRLQKDKDGLTAMARYITKSPEDKGSKKDKGKGQKRWTPSKGLRQPQEKVTHYKIKAKDVDTVVRNENALPELLKKWYGAQGYNFTEGRIKYNDFNGRFYIYARMWKPKEEETDARQRDGTHSRAKGNQKPKKRVEAKKRTAQKKTAHPKNQGGSSGGDSDGDSTGSINGTGKLCKR